MQIWQRTPLRIMLDEQQQVPRACIGYPPKKGHPANQFVLAFQGDQKKKEIRALNPRGTVPILVEEGPIVVYDSLAAISWIHERRNRGQQLMSPLSDLQQRAMVGAPLLMMPSPMHCIRSWGGHVLTIAFTYESAD
jgi:glutathione S-transferase